MLRKQGLLIDLNIAGTGMFSRAASWADLGIADIEEDKRSTQFTRGQKILIPDGMVKRLKSVKARMSQALERNSYKITGFHLSWADAQGCWPSGHRANGYHLGSFDQVVQILFFRIRWFFS